MDKNTIYILLGLGALAAVVFALTQTSSSSTSYGIDPGTASTVGAIVTANSNALNTQAGEQVSLATIDANLVGKLADSQNTLALGENNNTTAISLASITADTARLSDTLNYQEATYGLETNLQSSLAGFNAKTAQTAINAGASETIAKTTSDAAVTASNNAANAQKSVANSNMWGNIVGSVVGAAKTIFPFFSGGSQTATSNVLPAVGSVGSNVATATYTG